MTAPRTDIANLERPALEEALVARGHQRFRARQIFQWIYRHGVTELADPTMSDVPRGLREQLAAEFALTTPELVHRERSVDGTEKFLLRLADGQQIESVFIPDTPSMTFCISTQVGCAMACAMSSALRVAVPLKSMCSTKWAMPPCAAVSSREPRVSQTPMLTDRT